MLSTMEQIKNQLIPRWKKTASDGKIKDVIISAGNASVDNGTLYIELPSDTEGNITKAQIEAIIAGTYDAKS